MWWEGAVTWFSGSNQAVGALWHCDAGDNSGSMCKRGGKMRRNCRPRYSKTVSVRCHGNDDGSRGRRVTGWLLCWSESLLSVWHWNCISRKSSFIKTHRPLTRRHEFYPFRLLLKSPDAGYCIELHSFVFPKKTAFHLLDLLSRLYLQTFQDFESCETSFPLSPGSPLARSWSSL